MFFYPNTATAREGLDAYEKKLRLRKIAIVGLGGTGSYILDAVAKTPVEEIDLYDSDVIEPANGYRMLGALSIEEAHEGLWKTEHLAQVYGRMRTGIQSHPVRIDETNVDHLNDCEFVFIAVDHGPSRGLIARHLAQRNIPFIDVGIGVEKVPEDVQLRARVRATAVTNASKALVEGLPVGDDEEDVVYNNIQVAELNAVNAMLAVVLYKQKIGFFAEEIPVSKLRYVSSWQRLSNDAAEKI